MQHIFSNSNAIRLIIGLVVAGIVMPVAMAQAQSPFSAQTFLDRLRNDSETVSIFQSFIDRLSTFRSNNTQQIESNDGNQPRTSIVDTSLQTAELVIRHSSETSGLTETEARERCAEWINDNPGARISCAWDGQLINEQQSNPSVSDSGSRSDTSDNSTDTSDADNFSQTGLYKVFIELDSQSGLSLNFYQKADAEKQESRSHCAANMSEWLERYSSEHPGKNITCVWDDGAGDTWRNVVPIEGNQTDSQTESDTNTITASTETDRFLQHAYSCVLGRSPDADGYNFWADQIDNQGVPYSRTLKDMFTSSEYADFNKNNSAFLDDVYQCILLRSSEGPGKTFWMNALEQDNDRSGVVDSFLNSTEYQEENINNTLSLTPNASSLVAVAGMSLTGLDTLLKDLRFVIESLMQ